MCASLCVEASEKSVTKGRRAKTKTSKFSTGSAAFQSVRRVYRTIIRAHATLNSSMANVVINRMYPTNHHRACLVSCVRAHEVVRVG